MKLDYHVLKSIADAFFGMFVGTPNRWNAFIARKAEAFASAHLAQRRVAA